MKTYFKVLLITLSIQIVCFGINKLSSYINSDGLSRVALIIFVLGIIISTFLGVFLPLKWYSSKKQAFIAMFLLPTNYSWLIILYIVLGFFSIIYQILIGLPDNFG